MAGRFTDAKEAIRDRADIVEVIGGYVPLQQKGHDYKGRCPFHEEKTPSFVVHAEGRYQGFWKCFGCGVKGDVFTFVQMIERVSFVEALRMLAERYGVPLDSTPGEAKGKADVYRALDRASLIYEKALWSPSELGEKGRRYLESRGITEQTAREFRLGIAPDAWDKMLARLDREGMPPGLVAEAGLARRSERDGRYFDFLRDRLIFPIFDQQGRVIALAGRAFGDSGPKYLNTSETTTFRKREILYGFDRAWRRKERPDRLILVEGYTDVILAHQAGFAGAVACLGTAFGADHCRLVRRIKGPMLVVFDGDAAGERAALRTFEVMVREGIEGEVVTLPDGLDPADMIVQRGAAAFAAALETSEPAIDFVVDVVKRQQEGGNIPVRAVEQIAPLIAGAPDRLRRETLARHVAGRLGVNTASVEEKVEALRSQENQREQWKKRRASQSDGRHPARSEGPTGSPVTSSDDGFVAEAGGFEENRIEIEPPSALDRAVAQLLVLAPEALLAEAPELATGQGVEHPQCRVIVCVAAELFAQHGPCSLQQVLDALPAEVREAAVGILLDEQPEDRPELETEAREAAQKLRSRARDGELRRLRQEQAEALRSGDLARAEVLLRELASLARSSSSR